MHLSKLKRNAIFLFITCLGFPGVLIAELNRPDVLFIAIDDLNDYVSILGGHPDARTPNLDRLAALSVNFTNAHAASPVCNSSRCALMTGRHPFVTGVYENRQPSEDIVRRYGSLNREFLNSGYHVAGSGKIYHQFYFADEGWSETSEKFKWPRPKQSNFLKLSGGFSDAAILADATEEKTGDYQSVSWISKRLQNPPADKPQFLACGIYRPHTKWQVPQKYFDMFPVEELNLPPHLQDEDDLADVPTYGKQLAYSGAGEKIVKDPNSSSHAEIVKAGHWKDCLRAYLACVAYADAQLGRLLDAWEASPRRDQTIIVLWSDHGWHLGEKRHWRKATLWEESTRVPFLIRVPGMTEDGSTCDRVVSLIDVYPTLRDVCGLSGGGKLDGNSLRPLLVDPLSANWRDYALTTFRDASISVRTPRYRLIRYADGTGEFYDHQSDPQEYRNRIDDEAFSYEVERMSVLLPTETAKPVSKKK
jgi:arylsulfatase A-like enzyme